ncbi:MAG: hypothetical protein QF551_00165, partial [Candidatus Marinimicrobia bacterium]|nr:hypothetical protein [Candidatus Neomarinimicrobiota bacterium]
GDGHHILLITAALIGFIHTLIGPDHYLPFIMISRARSWSLRKITFVTFLCGMGHVLRSVILGLIEMRLSLLKNTPMPWRVSLSPSQDRQ